MDTNDALAEWAMHIDDFEEGVITGWVWDKRRPDFAVSLNVSSTSGEKLTVLANAFRPDLLDAGLGNGRHAFAADISAWDLAGNTITVIPAGARDPSVAILISTDMAASLTRKPWSDEYFRVLNDLALPFAAANHAE